MNIPVCLDPAKCLMRWMRYGLHFRDIHQNQKSHHATDESIRNKVERGEKRNKNSTKNMLEKPNSQTDNLESRLDGGITTITYHPICGHHHHYQVKCPLIVCTDANVIISTKAVYKIVNLFIEFWHRPHHSANIVVGWSQPNRPIRLNGKQIHMKNVGLYPKQHNLLLWIDFSGISNENCICVKDKYRAGNQLDFALHWSALDICIHYRHTKSIKNYYIFSPWRFNVEFNPCSSLHSPLVLVRPSTTITPSNASKFTNRANKLRKMHSTRHSTFCIIIMMMIALR